MNPWYVWERLKEVRNPNEFLKKVMVGLKLAKWYLRNELNI